MAQLTLHGVDLGKVNVETTSTKSISTNVVAYPTDSKVREQEARRAAKEAGHEIVRAKRKKFVENHNDDCGEDMSSIGVDTILLNSQWIDQCDSTDSEGDLLVPISSAIYAIYKYSLPETWMNSFSLQTRMGTASLTLRRYVVAKVEPLK